MKGHSKTHPTQNTLTPCWEKEKRETKNFGWMIEKKAKELEMNEVDVSSTVPLSVLQPWILPHPAAVLTLLKKKDKLMLHHQTMQTYTENNFYSSVQICTDASNNLAHKIDVAFTVPEFNIKSSK